MKLTRLEGIIAVSVAVATIEVSGANRALAADPPAAQPSTADVLMKVHQTNMKEIELGKMAESKGGSKEVKDFGKMLVKDHTSADHHLMALAKKEKVDVGKEAAKAAEMPTISQGPEFDSQFAKTLLDDHKKDIAELTDARDHTSSTGLKEYLNTILPTLKKHEATAQKILDKTKK